MGVFSEDKAIRVSTVINLWVAEGFLKPIGGKNLEEIAEEYLKELINRNLILIHKLGSTGNKKFCNIHDLLRDLCLRESQKERFYNVTRKHCLNLPQGMNSQHRIVISNSTSKEEVADALQSMSLARSLICNTKGVLLPLKFKLLRILKAYDKDKFRGDEYFLENTFQLVNSRYIFVRAKRDSEFASSVYLLWNLHTLVVNRAYWGSAPVEIWNLPQLRHIEFGGLYLPDPPSGNIGGQEGIVLENLHTLGRVINFKCVEEVVKRIPNIKKLKILYDEVEGSSGYHLNNLDRLHKLESLWCFSFPNIEPDRTDFLQNLTFPHSLKKLTLQADPIHWEDMLDRILSLPLLEKLKLAYGSFKGRNWETVEGQFCSLRFLLIENCNDMEYWTTESSHFPRLERLVLRHLYDLDEIPSDVGEIPTLQSIELKDCSDSAVLSAKRILEEQEELGEEGLHVRVTLARKNETLEELASPRFHVERWFD